MNMPPGPVRYRIDASPTSAVRCRWWLENRKGPVSVARVREILDAIPEDAEVHISWAEWTEESTPEERLRWDEIRVNREQKHLDWLRREVLDKFGYVIPNDKEEK